MTKRIKTITLTAAHGGGLLEDTMIGKRRMSELRYGGSLAKNIKL